METFLVFLFYLAGRFLTLFQRMYIVPFRFAQQRPHHIGGLHLAGESQMCVDIGCRAYIAVSQSLGDTFEIHTVFQKQGGCCVTQIVETNMRQAVGLQDLLKLVRYIVRTQQCTVLPTKDISAVMIAA